MELDQGAWLERIRSAIPRRVIVAACLVLFVIGAGVGGYLVGSSPDVDLDGARLDAAEHGRQAGARVGDRQGYERGFKSASERPYASVYATAYRRAYEREFEAAGLDPPQNIPVPDAR